MDYQDDSDKGEYDLTIECVKWVDRNGELHRGRDKPALINSYYREWYFHGQLHRDGDKPAVMFDDGLLMWYRYGKQHRDGGPATTRLNGWEEWWVDGKLHNLCGFAKISQNNDLCEWWINGKKYATRETYEAARDVYCQKHNIIIPGRLTKRIDTYE